MNNTLPFHFCPRCGSSRFLPTSPRSFRCEDCRFEFFFNVAAAAAALILDADNRLLVSVRANNPAKGTLDLPGGFLEFGESGEQALHRELLEELGTDVLVRDYAFSFPNIYHYSGLDIHTLDLFYWCHLPQDAVLSPHDDVAALQWISIPQLNPTQFGLSSIRNAISRITSQKQVRDAQQRIPN